MVWRLFWTVFVPVEELLPSRVNPVEVRCPGSLGPLCHGREALEIFRMRKDEISLVILDLTMPGMNGWETLEALRALRPDIPVVLASGYDMATAMEGKRAELLHAFLPKPYSMAELKAAIGVTAEKSSAA